MDGHPKSNNNIGSKQDIRLNNDWYPCVKYKQKPNKCSCFKRILILASIKERSTKELKIRLIEKEGYDPNDVEKALCKSIDLDIVDDLRYAEFYCRNKISANRGLKGILNHLEELEIEYSKSDEILTMIKYAENNQIEIAMEVLSMHQTRSKNKYASFLNKLIRWGFDYQTAQTATKNYISKISSLDISNRQD